MSSDESLGRVVARYRSLIFVGVICLFCMLATGVVYGQVERWKVPIIEDAALITICEDDVFLGLTSLTSGSCVREARTYTMYCWAQLNSVIGTGKESGNPANIDRESERERKTERNISISWLFARCIQSSMLLPHTSQLYKNEQSSRSDVHNSGNIELSDWKAATEKSISIYNEIRPILVEMREKLSSAGYDTVFAATPGVVKAISRRNNEGVSVELDSEDDWVSFFNSSSINSASRNGVEYQFKYAPSFDTSKYTFDYIFVEAPADTLKVCHTSYEGIDCGACDLSVDKDVIARIVWISNDVILEGARTFLPNGDAMTYDGVSESFVKKCWAKGMAKLGYDQSELGAPTVPRR